MQLTPQTARKHPNQVQRHATYESSSRKTQIRI